jgi:phage tail tube protein FII
MKPEEILSKEEGDMLPRFAITDVNMTLDQEDTVVSVHGSGSGVHLNTPPLFRTKRFEEAMREWLARETSKTLVPKVKAHIAEIEEGIWKNVPFEYRGLGYRMRYSLADKIKVADNYLEVSINSELYDVDHGEFKEKLRRITPQFSESPEELRTQDLEVVFDENIINHVLLALHYNSTVISLRQLLLGLIPEKYKNYMMLAQALF